MLLLCLSHRRTVEDGLSGDSNSLKAMEGGDGCAGVFRRLYAFGRRRWLGGDSQNKRLSLIMAAEVLKIIRRHRQGAAVGSKS